MIEEVVMKKIGIVTMIGGTNYGNVLQNYAMQYMLKKFGWDAYTLNDQTRGQYQDKSSVHIPAWKKISPSYLAEYSKVKMNSRYGCKNSRDFVGIGLYKAIKNVNQLQQVRLQREKVFEQFRNKYIQTDMIPVRNEESDRRHLTSYKAFVCGSDQIWHPKYNTLIQFLQFAPPEKRIAIAPSIGVSEIPESRKDYFTKWISEIPSLSVRENRGAEIIKELTGREAEVVADPTVVLTADQWSEIARKPKRFEDKNFVLCYFLGNEKKEYVQWIERAARVNKCDIVSVFDIRDLRYYATSPEEFVWLISHAKAVFTDSFHGVVFSINYKVPFVAFERIEGGMSMSSRIQSILQRTGLESRMFKEIKNRQDQIFDCDYKAATMFLQNEREHLKTFVFDALQRADKNECTED